MTDEQTWIAAAARGDREAWGKLYARHNGRVVVCVIRTGASPQQAIEYAQEAWVRLMARAERGELQDLRLPGLAITTATNLARDGWRRTRESLEDPEAEAHDQAPSMVEVLIARDRLQRAHQVLDDLPARTRDVFQAWHEDPTASQESIAHRLGVSRQHLRDTLCRVRKLVKDALGRSE